MKRAILIREASAEDGTFGRIFFGAAALYTVERPWADNRSDVSCIPPGLYPIRKTWSPRFKRRLILIDPVPGPRLGCRFHAANRALQLNGCVAPGERRGTIEGVRAVLLSAPAVRRIEEWLGDETAELEVRNG